MGMRIMVAFAASLIALCSFGTEYFVATNGVDKTDDANWGRTEATAYLSIQAAVNAAAANDTITLLPGDHVTGLTDNTHGRSRVEIDKVLTVRSKNGRASRDATRIVGAWDTTSSGSHPYGMGPNRIRCVCVTASGAGSRFEGITFYRGAALHDSSVTDQGCGGGIFACDNKGVTAVDCAFRECQARNGSGMCSMSSSAANYAVRCLFKNNRCYKFGFGFRGGRCYNCVFDDNDFSRNADGSENVDGSARSSGAMGYCEQAVNCTFVCNKCFAAGSNNIVMRNCLMLHNEAGNLASAVTTYDHCVSSDASRTANGSVCVGDYNAFPEVYSTVDEDYRLVRDAKSMDVGTIDNLNRIPAEFRGTDYYGNPRTTDGVVYCGAVQGVVDGESSGVRIVGRTDGHWEKDGVAIDCRVLAVAQAPGRHATVNLRFVPDDGKEVLLYTSAGSRQIVPKRDGSGWFGAMTTNRLSSVQATTMDANALWVDAAAEAAGADGSAEKPFATIQAAVDAAVASAKPCVVRVKAGDYNSGETTQTGMKNRVAIPNTLHRSLKIVAVDGPETTFITGAEDPSGTGAWKLGENAVRCIVNSATNTTVVIQGFTLRDARTASSSDSADTGRGGALCSRGVDVINSCYLADCLVTNCVAGTGSCAYGGNVQRCRIVGGCIYNGAVRSGTAISCLVTGCAANDGDSRALGSYITAYNCTVVDVDAVGMARALTEIRNSVFYNCGRTTIVNTPENLARVTGNLYWKTNVEFNDGNVQEDPIRMPLT